MSLELSIQQAPYKRDTRDQNRYLLFTSIATILVLLSSVIPPMPRSQYIQIWTKQIPKILLILCNVMHIICWLFIELWKERQESMITSEIMPFTAIINLILKLTWYFITVNSAQANAVEFV